MEKRKLYSNTIRLGIQALVLLFAFQAHSFQFHSVGFDLGLSGSFLFTDESGGQFGGGSGYQSSVYATFDIDKDYLVKLQWDFVRMNQDLWNDTTFDSNNSLLEVEQRYHLILAGIEVRNRTWFWEAFSGFSIGQDGSYLLKNIDNESHQRIKAKTNSFPLIGAAIGYRMPYKDFHITARLKTFSLLSNIYKDELDDNFFFTLPFLMSVGINF